MGASGGLTALAAAPKANGKSLGLLSTNVGTASSGGGTGGAGSAGSANDDTGERSPVGRLSSGGFLGHDELRLPNASLRPRRKDFASSAEF